MKFKKIVALALAVITVSGLAACTVDTSTGAAHSTDTSFTQEEATGEGTQTTEASPGETTLPETETETDKAETTAPEETEPVTTQPVTAEPETTEPVTTAPETTEPETTLPSETEPPATEPPETEPPETEAPTTAAKEVTKAPTVISTASTAPDRVVIFGIAAEECVIISQNGSVVEENRTTGKYFYIEVSGATGTTASVRLTARAEGKEESSGIICNVTFKKESSNVWVGRNSRLLYMGTLSNMLGSPVADENEIYTAWGLTNATLKNIQSATGKDTKLIISIIPNPATVYYDEQRDFLYAGGLSKESFPGNVAYQYIEYMNSNAVTDDIYVLDLRQALYDHKDEQIFFATDTHYTELGAYYCYLEIMEAVKKSHPNVKIRKLGTDYSVEYMDLPGGDMTSMVGLSGMKEHAPFFIANFSDTGSYYNSKRADGMKVAGFGPSAWQQNSSLNSSSNPTAYFIGDSYGCYILPFIGANFSKVWTNSGVLWNYTMDYNLLAANKPDYVIFLICERNVKSDLSIMG